MDDLIDSADAGGNAPELSVSELSGAVKRTLEGAFGRVRVRGEVGRTMISRMGHCYFDLKDERAVMSAVAFKGVVSRLETRPEEGMEVIATGRISTFAGQSKYQLIVEDVSPAGVGALMAMFEKRKKALEAEGLFSPDRKREIPYIPDVIGVVTSPTGAVIRDILHRLRERFPRKVLIWPATVQGKNCVPEVVAGIRGFNALPEGGRIPRPDVIIVARGGGSIEDLWGFNEEAVVRAAADSRIPLISAVGHETDVTLIDYAADRRAPTPTAAAEMAVPVRAELVAHLAKLEERRVGGLVRTLTSRRERLGDLGRLLPKPQALTQERAQRVDALATLLPKVLLKRAGDARLSLERRGAGRFGPALLSGGLRERRERLTRGEAGLQRDLGRLVRDGRKRLAEMARRTDAVPLHRPVEAGLRDLAAAAAKAEGAMALRLRDGCDRLAGLARVMATLDHRATLRRGFALVRDENGRIVTRAEGAPGELEVEFQDGRLAVVSGGGTRRAPARKPASPKRPDDDQGSLF